MSNAFTAKPDVSEWARKQRNAKIVSQHSTKTAERTTWGGQTPAAKLDAAKKKGGAA